jgi:hypothetical protein
MIGSLILGRSAPGPIQQGGSPSGTNDVGIFDAINTIADILAPCVQIAAGAVLAFGAPVFAYATLIEMNVFDLETAGASALAGIFLASEELIWLPVVGGYLMARGVARGGQCN